MFDLTAETLSFDVSPTKDVLILTSWKFILIGERIFRTELYYFSLLIQLKVLKVSLLCYSFYNLCGLILELFGHLNRAFCNPFL